MRTLAILSAVALLTAIPAGAVAYSTASEVIVTRGFTPAKPKPGDTVTVTLQVKVGAIAAPLRGFYLAEAVPSTLKVTNPAATLNGSIVAAKVETSTSGAVYSSCDTVRWILETPPSFGESHPLDASSTLSISYNITLPASVSASISFPGHSWVGMAASLGDAGDHFGFEDSAATLQVEGGTTVDGAVLSDAAVDAPGMDGALQTDAGLAGREAGPGLQARDTLTGGCAVAAQGGAGGGDASAMWVLLGLLWRRWWCGSPAV